MVEGDWELSGCDRESWEEVGWEREGWEEGWEVQTSALDWMPKRWKGRGRRGWWSCCEVVRSSDWEESE